MVTFGELANTFGVNVSSGLRKPRVRNPALQFANAFGVNTSRKGRHYYRQVSKIGVRLFVAQTLDGIEARGFARRPDTKDYAYAN